MVRPIHLPSLALVFLLGTMTLPASAQQQPIYKCGSRNAPVYTQVPCNGGKQLGAKRAKAAKDPAATPPQDRARLMARAKLPPETREQCNALEGDIKSAEGRIKAEPGSVTEKDEGDLAIRRIRFRELRC